MLMSTDADAWAFFERCAEDMNFANDRYLPLSSISQFSVVLDPGDGSVTRNIHQTYTLMQRNLDFAFRLAKTGSLIGNITPYERQMLALEMRVSSGSTIINFDLGRAIDAIQRMVGSRHNTRAGNIVSVACAVLLCSTPALLGYMYYHSQVDPAQINAEAAVKAASIQRDGDIKVASIKSTTEIELASLSRGATANETVVSKTIVAEKQDLEVKRPIILAGLTATDPSRVIAFVSSDYVPWRPALLDLAPIGGTLQVNNMVPVSYSTAKGVAKVARSAATKARMVAKREGHKGFLPAPWATEVVRYHSAPGAMQLGA